MSLTERSHAAHLLSLCTTPHAAAVLAVLPSHPGADLDEGEVLSACGLPVRDGGSALSALVAARVVERIDGRVRLARGHLKDVEDALVADSPLQPVLATRPELTAFIRFGRWDRDPVDVAVLVDAVATILPQGEHTEAAITAWLAEIHDDPAALRRGLVDAGRLGRAPDGSRYWRT